MRITVVLPTADAALAADRREAYARHGRIGTVVSARALHERVPADADPSDAFVVPEILEAVIAAADDGADAVIVDCMEDPAVEEARRLVRIPVIGPGHAALCLAAQLSYRFSILYPLPQVRLIERLVEAHGFRPVLGSIRQLSCGLETIRADADATLAALLEAALAAVREDGAHAVVPACTLTSALVPELAWRLRSAGCPVPVVDGPGAAMKLAENLVALELQPSHVTYPPALGVSRRIR